MMVSFVQGLEVSPMMVIFAILLIYIVLGMVLESMSMLLLTVPVFYPLVADLGFDLVWYGIVVVVVTEISLITPPVGMNVFVLGGALKDIRTGTIFKGILPFWGADMSRLALFVMSSQRSMLLPPSLCHS